MFFKKTNKLDIMKLSFAIDDRHIMKRYQGCVRCLEDAIDLFKWRFVGLDIEQIYIAYLTAEGNILAVIGENVGDCLASYLDIRNILRHAIILSADSLILAHNHPSGDPTPSYMDRDTTKRLALVTRMAGIKLLDHLIFANKKCQSFHSIGLL